MPEDILLDNIKPKTKTAIAKAKHAFEVDKNRKAFLYMAVSAGAILLITLLVSFHTPLPDPPPPKPVENLVEVELDEMNFGNDENGGMGDLQPLRKFAPAPPEAAATNDKNDAPNPTPPNNPLTEDDNEDAPTVRKPREQTPPTTNNRPSSNNTSPRTSSNDNAPTRRNPAVFTRPGATGSGGNNASRNNGVDQFGNGRGEGTQGNPNGIPGGTGNRILKKADLNNNGEIANILNRSGTNYNGTVHIEISVNAAGNFAGIRSIYAAPSTAAGKAAIAFVKSDVLYKLKFDTGADNRKASIDLEFRH